MKTIARITVFISALSFLSFVFFPRPAHALSTYSMNDVSQHDNQSDCWMIINSQVYNLTAYLPDHDRQLNIRPWCGKEATRVFDTKNGRGMPHSSQAQSLLSQFLIGALSANTSLTNTPSLRQTSAPATTPNAISNAPPKTTNPYNLLIPLIGTIVLYLVSVNTLARKTHNFIWNTVMLLGLIPSFLFGILMILMKSYPGLSVLSGFGILYFHVELSIVFGTACVLHFLLRRAIYVAEGKR